MTARSENPWLTVVGIGEDGLEGVAPAGRALINSAEILVGGDRHLAMIDVDHPAERWVWTSPLSETLTELRALTGRRVCVLATGDPISFGIGATLAREFGPEALSVVPAPGAFSLAAARLGWPLEEVTRLTLHGRSLDRLRLYLAPGARLLALSADGETPALVARLLTELGWGASDITVLERLGGAREAITTMTAQELCDTGFEDLNTLAVSCVPGPEARIFSLAAGLPDDAFEHDGQLTKRETRAATLAGLAPTPGALLWDIGCGNGSVSIEWMRLGGRAAGLEPDPERRSRAARNAISLGSPELTMIDGKAPDALAALPPGPDAVFVGGGVGADGVLEACWGALKPGGRLVANAVTMESESRLAVFHATIHDAAETVEMARLAVSRLDKVGPHHGWRPFMPVTQLRAVKPFAQGEQ
ncbi:MAG: precorrin-6y C5,15-methyltransferase (decarboxylating) subunit CbiE [Alphaproteobacteria bacterium]|nr:precorrin-6y C5,15-methyltransferase (decarboxylating) subunit CbiE [Alphaproteobacteria bacterium]